MCWVIQASVRETLLGWQGSFIGRKRKKVWSAAPLSLFWTIWKERNRRSFENMKLSVQRLKVLVFMQFTILDKHVYRTYFYVFSWFYWLVGDGLREGVFFVFPILFGAIRQPLYALCVLWGAPFGVFIQFALAYQKKKKKLSVPCKVTLGLQKIFHSTLSKWTIKIHNGIILQIAVCLVQTKKALLLRRISLIIWGNSNEDMSIREMIVDHKP